jgi:YD repeat-containing protein
MVRGLSGQVIVVAGAGRGIGAATAIRLAEEGAQIVVGDLVGEGAEKTAASIREAGGSAVAVRYDAADESSVQTLAAAATSSFGKLDGWHNNAADTSITGSGSDLLHDAATIPMELWDHTFDVNLRGFLFGVRAAIPLMLENGGAFVHTSSNGAFSSIPRLTAYNAAKAGVNSLSRHVATRWGREGVRSNVVSPGYVKRPERLAVMTPEILEETLSVAHSPRLGTPEDIAAAVAFLFSSDAAFINGQVLSVDGGQLMR